MQILLFYLIYINMQIAWTFKMDIGYPEWMLVIGYSTI